jgi:hypothetical protein
MYQEVSMDMDALDFMVKFTSAGCFAVCLLAVLWAAVKLKAKPDPEWAAAYARFTNTCVGIAVIAGVVGVSNAFLNYGQVAVARNEAQTAKEDANDLQQQFDDALARIETLAAATQRAGEAEKQFAGATDKSRNQAMDLAAALTRLEKAVQSLKSIDSEIDYVSDAISRLNNLPPSDSLSLRSQIADIKKRVREGLP